MTSDDSGIGVSFGHVRARTDTQMIERTPWLDLAIDASPIDGVLVV